MQYAPDGLAITDMEEQEWVATLLHPLMVTV